MRLFKGLQQKALIKLYSILQCAAPFYWSIEHGCYLYFGALHQQLSTHCYIFICLPAQNLYRA